MCKELEEDTQPEGLDRPTARAGVRVPSPESRVPK
jgi:hypothetical protein